MFSRDYEPLEVCILKKQLATLTCKCSVCEKHPDSTFNHEVLHKKTDKDIQAGPLREPLDQILHINYSKLNTNLEALCNHVSCPGCYIALNLLKARETKVFKDEETETKAGSSCCDKSIGKCVKFVERTTSTSSVSKPAFESSKTSFYDKTNTMALNGIMKKRSNEYVTFLHNEPIIMQKQDFQPLHGNCFCLQNFVDSIRPHLTNV